MENDWGQAALNNDFGWGQGARTGYESGWGSYMIISYSGQTNITGMR